MSIIPVIQVALSYFIPESPIFLFHQKKFQKVDETLNYLFQDDYGQEDFDFKEENTETRIRRLSVNSDSLRDSITEFTHKRGSVISTKSTYISPTTPRTSRQQVKFEKKMQKSILYRIYSDASLLRPIAYACLLTVARNLSGMDIISYYLTNILKNNLKFDRKTSQLLSVILVSFRVLYAILGSCLSHKFSRKFVLLASILGIAACFASVFILNLINFEGIIIGIFQIILISAAYFFSDIGIGSITWLIAAEIMEPSYKNISQQITMVFHFVVLAICIYLFTFLQERLGSFLFLIFVICNLLFLAYFYFRGVETKGVQAQEIAQQFSRRNSTF